MRYVSKIIAIWGMAAALAGCSSSAVYTHRIIHGTTYHAKLKGGGGWRGPFQHYDPYNYARRGHLQLGLNTVGYVALDGRPTLQISIDILRANLTFPHGHPATVTLRIHATAHNNVDTTIHEQLTISRHNNQISYYYLKRLQVPPGKYTVHVRLDDQTDGQTVERTARTTVAPPESDTTQLGNVRMAIKGPGGWHPQPAYNVPGRVDSLRFTLRATNDSAGLPLKVQARMLRFRDDSTPARWNHFYYRYKYRPSTLTYQGIDYRDSTVIHRDLRTLTAPGSVEIRFQFQRPPHGNYRFIVQSDHGQLKGRAFAVRSPSFPAVRTPREQAAPLIYLMRRDSLRGTEEMKALLRKATQNEVTLQGHSFSRIKTNTSAYKALMATAKQDSLRVAVRHFWQSHIGDPRKARKVATLYYQRVRAVNELFSNYKEGWKTPRGMTYILFGPPSSVWHYKPPYYESIPGIAKRIAWYYRDSDISPGWLNDTAYPGRNLWGIGFFQPRLQAPSFPFEQFLLNGGCPFCGGVQGITNQVKLMGWLHYKQHQIITWIHHKQQLWLSGNILQEKIYYHRSGTHRVGNY